MYRRYVYRARGMEGALGARSYVPARILRTGENHGRLQFRLDWYCRFPAHEVLNRTKKNANNIIIEYSPIAFFSLFKLTVPIGVPGFTVHPQFHIRSIDHLQRAEIYVTVNIGLGVEFLDWSLQRITREAHRYLRKEVISICCG